MVFVWMTGVAVLMLAVRLPVCFLAITRMRYVAAGIVADSLRTTAFASCWGLTVLIAGWSSSLRRVGVSRRLGGVDGSGDARGSSW